MSGKLRLHALRIGNKEFKMQTLQAVIVGAVQGISEFLPISSSAHIVFSQSIYKLLSGGQTLSDVAAQEVFFDIIVHLATLFAVLIFFRKDIINIIKAFFSGLKNKDYSHDDFKIAVYIAAATPITCAVALILKEPTHALLENPKIVSLFLILTGFILFFSEKLKSKNKEIDIKTSLWTGLAQGLAIFPGLSRSGLTIATQVFLGVDRVKAARFSFLMSIPVIIGASMVFPLLEMDFSQAAQINVKAFFWGFLTSFVTGYLCIKYFMKLLGKITLKCFSYYCFAAGLAMFVLFSVCHRL